MAAALLACGRPGEREYAAGLRALARGRDVEARTLLEKSIQRRPGAAENARAYNYLGIACRRQNEMEAAAAAFQESRRRDPSRWEPAYNLAVIYAAAGDDVRAATLLEEAALTDPAAALPLEFLGFMHARRGRWSEARSALREAAARDPRSPRLLTRLALVEAQLDGLDAARARLLSALEIQSDYPAALFNLFALESRHPGRRAEAAAYGRRFLIVARDHPRAAEVRDFIAAGAPMATEAATPTPARAATPSGPAAVPAGTEPAADWRAEAQRRVELGDAAGAVNVCLQVAAMAQRRGDEAGREQALRTAAELAFDQPAGHAALGRYWLEKGRAELALRSLKQANALGDNSESTLLALAESAQRAGESDTALVALRRAAQRPQAGAEALWRLAEFYDQELRSAADAAREYRAFLARFPGDARVMRARDRIQALTPRPAPAPETATPAQPSAASTEPPALAEAPVRPPPPVEGRRLSWRPSATRNPAAAAQAYNRAREYHRRGDRDRAIFFFTRAIENDDSMADAFIGLGTIYIETGDAELAKDAYRLALERRPGDATTRYNYALALHALGERDAAAAETARVLREQPDLANAHYLMGVLLAEDAARRNEARAHFQRFLALAPDHDNAPVVRRWLDEPR